jgi:hypothetical protein
MTPQEHPERRRRTLPAIHREVLTGLRHQAAWSASWGTCGRTISWRGAACAEVQAQRAGHARQVAPSNRMRVTGSPDTSRPGRQLTVVWPWGHCACWTSQSMTKAWRSIACPCQPLPAVGPKRRTNHIDLMRPLGSDQEVRMRFKVQIVVCAEDGQEETAHEMMVLDKACQRIEHQGLTMAEAKQLLTRWPSAARPSWTKSSGPLSRGVLRTGRRCPSPMAPLRSASTAGWYLWHGNVFKALPVVQSVEMDLEAALATSGHGTTRKASFPTMASPTATARASAPALRSQLLAQGLALRIGHGAE